MSRPTRILGTLVVLVPAVLAVAGFYRLFALRLEQGDVYPPNSTLRSDPLGARVLHDSLAASRQVAVDRLFKPLEMANLGAHSTLFVIGDDPHGWAHVDAGDLRDFDAFMSEGGRLVIAFETPKYGGDLQGSAEASADGKRGDNAKATKGRKADSKGARRDGEKPASNDDKSGASKPVVAEAGKSDQPKVIPRTQHWGVDIRMAETSAPPGRVGIKTAQEIPEAGAPALTWRSPLFFEPHHPLWQTIYVCEGRPVIIERAWGRGTLVMASDTYFLSNEAMLRDRQPALLSWLVGTSGRVVFDERHLGVAEEHGVTTLARKYRLGGLAAALLVLALLYLWKNGVPLVPPWSEASGEADVAGGIQTRDGIISLLRRNIPAQDLPALCLAEWERTRPRGADIDRRAERMRRLVEDEDRKPLTARNPVALYRALCEVMNEPEGTRHE